MKTTENPSSHPSTAPISDTTSVGVQQTTAGSPSKPAVDWKRMPWVAIIAVVRCCRIGLRQNAFALGRTMVQRAGIFARLLCAGVFARAALAAAGNGRGQALEGQLVGARRDRLWNRSAVSGGLRFLHLGRRAGAAADLGRHCAVGRRNAGTALGTAEHLVFGLHDSAARFRFPICWLSRCSTWPRPRRSICCKYWAFRPRPKATSSC